MMPLCTTANLPFWLTWGWELSIEGLPCVAQTGMADAQRTRQRLNLERLLHIVQRSNDLTGDETTLLGTVAIPAESYPRYSRRRRPEKQISAAVPVSDIANNSTHERYSLKKPSVAGAVSPLWVECANPLPFVLGAGRSNRVGPDCPALARSGPRTGVVRLRDPRTSRSMRPDPRAPVDSNPSSAACSPRHPQ